MIKTARAIREVSEEVHPYLREWLGEERAGELARFICKRLEDGLPSIMVYGIYNAGKSTLLNALAGKEAAPVSNRPETSAVTPYRWRDFVILDTPGIDAPQEHEAISRRQLEDADAVIFVLDSTSTFEEERVYAELTGILSARKRTMVVVNDKTGLTNIDRESQVALDKVLRNLQQQCNAKGIDASSWTEMPLRMVDARTALKGRLEEKPRLVEQSGIEELERDLDRLLRDADIGDVVNTVGNRLLAALKDAAELTRQTDDGDALRVEEKRTAVAACRTAFDNNVREELRRLERRFQHEFPDLVRHEQSAGQGLRAMVDELVEGVEAVLNTELVRAERILAQQGIPFHALSSEQMKDEWVGPTEPDEAVAGGWKEATGDDHAFAFDPMAAETIRRLAPQLTRHAAEPALHWIKRILPSLMKGVGPKTIAKWADTLAGSLNYAFAAWELGCAVRKYFASDGEEKAAVREEKRLLDIASDEAGKLRASLQGWCRDIADIAFAPAETSLRDEAEALREDERGRAFAHRALLNLTDKVERLFEENSL